MSYQAEISEPTKHYVRIYQRNMQNKPNFKDAQMNVKSLLTMNYENKRDWTLGENKPNPSGLRCLLRSCRTDQTQFQTGHELDNRMKPKLLNFHLKIKKKPEKPQFPKSGWNQHGDSELFTFDNHDPKGRLCSPKRRHREVHLHQRRTPAASMEIAGKV